MNIALDFFNENPVVSSQVIIDDKLAIINPFI
jgi:hypothetical protein